MRREINLVTSLVLPIIVVCFLAPVALPAHWLGNGSPVAGGDGVMVAQSGGSAATSGYPRYTEAELTSLDGEIFINPLFTGKVNSVRIIDKNGLIGQKVNIELRILTDGWRKLSLPQSASGSFGVIVSGDEGILKISRLKNPVTTPAAGLQSANKVIIEFGSLSTTFLFPAMNVLEPSKVELGILNNSGSKFINGSIVAMKPDQAAVEFDGLPPTSVNKNGMMRVSLKEPGGMYINTDISAWGYDIKVSETDVETPAPITAQVFGLPQDAEIRFDFSSLSGQVIDPSTKILTVGEINKGTTVATITTKIGGAQPLTVTVKRVK
ncbi:MAG: hypothetical protein ACHQ6U_06575 [Thermodesulfobacteriota bacterium]